MDPVTKRTLFQEHRRIVHALIAISLAITISTIGYMIIEGVTLIESFFMTVVTISTVGYSEVFPLSDAGRLFTSIMILLNIIIVAYTISSFTEFIVEGQFLKKRKQKNMEKQIQKLTDHIIICGYSKYSVESIHHFDTYNQDFVLIERDEDKIESFIERNPNGLYIIADASDDSVLEMAQISNAKALIIAMADKSENIFITLSARALNERIKIIARTNENRTEAKLKKAGADHIIMPERMGGFYMATVVNKPGTVEFFDKITDEWESEVHIEEISYETIKKDFQDKTLQEMQIQDQTGANIIGFKDQLGQYRINPSGETSLNQGTSLIALGTEEQIKSLLAYCG